MARRLSASALFLFFLLLLAAPASAQEVPANLPGSRDRAVPVAEDRNRPGARAERERNAQGNGGKSGGIDVGIDDGGEGLSRTVTTILLFTVASVAPAILLLMTSFTRFIVVLALTRNAMGLQGIPPTQVLIGLSLFMTLFAMGPVLGQVNEDAIQPALAGRISSTQAMEKGFAPLRDYMLAQVDDDDLKLFSGLRDEVRPASREDVSASALIPAYVVSELRDAFLIGFIIFVPFLVIDLVFSASLMSLGMVMLPPVLISLPVKLLLFVLVDGWGLIVRSVLGSVTGGAG